MSLYLKLYEVFKDKFIRDYADQDYVAWQSFLEKNSIKQKIFDNEDQNYLYQEMLELANTNNGTWVVIDDPESDGDCNPEAEHHSILLVPKSFAEKVVVLNGVPEPE